MVEPILNYELMESGLLNEEEHENYDKDTSGMLELLMNIVEVSAVAVAATLRRIIVRWRLMNRLVDDVEEEANHNLLILKRRLLKTLAYSATGGLRVRADLKIFRQVCLRIPKHEFNAAWLPVLRNGQGVLESTLRDDGSQVHRVTFRSFQCLCSFLGAHNCARAGALATSVIIPRYRCSTSYNRVSCAEEWLGARHLGRTTDLEAGTLVRAVQYRAGYLRIAVKESANRLMSVDRTGAVLASRKQPLIRNIPVLTNTMHRTDTIRDVVMLSTLFWVPVSCLTPTHKGVPVVVYDTRVSKNCCVLTFEPTVLGIQHGVIQGE